MRKTHTTAQATTRRRRPAFSNAALVRELVVHQIELKMQNEELRRTQLDLAAARDRYVDLYDFAPVGYFTLDASGVVVEVNLTGASLLGQERPTLLHRNLARFIAAADGDRWHLHRLHTLQNEGVQRIELTLQLQGGELRQGQFDCLRVMQQQQPQQPQGEPLLRLTLTDITLRKQAEMDRRITTTTVHAREDERRHVARKLHEELGQRLSALKMELAGTRLAHDPATSDAHVDTMLESLDVAVATVRRIATDLRPLVLDDLGLNAAIDWLARDSARRNGTDIQLHLDDSDPPLGERTSVALYRMVQETLAHLESHSRGDKIRIALQQWPGELVLVVQGNGDDWPDARTAHWTIGQRNLQATLAHDMSHDADLSADPTQALREQAHMLGGRLELGATPGGGRSITVRLPLRRAADGHTLQERA